MTDHITQALITATMEELKDYPFLLCKSDVKKLLQVRYETAHALWSDMAVVGGERGRVPKVVFIDYLIRKGREGGLTL